MRTKQRMAKAISRSQALLAANKYILFHYPTMFTGGRPHRLSIRTADVWVVPIVLTHPNHGSIGAVGMLAVQARTGEIVGHTPRAVAVAAGKRLREAGNYAVEAAVFSAKSL